MDTCERYRNQLVDLLYGEIAGEERTALERHLDACARCRKEFAAMQRALSFMDRRERPVPDEADWDRFWKSLRNELTRGGSRPGILRRRPASLPAWAYGIAAVFLVAIGVFFGKIYFTPTQQTSPAPSITSAPSQAEPPDSTTTRALAYLDRSRNLLIGLTNIDEPHAVLDLSRHREASRELIEQGQVLAVALNRPDQHQIRQLIDDLRVILLQLANIELRPGVPVVELVRKGMDKKSILLKINLEEMKASSRRPSTESSQQKNSRHL